ncbi:MAG: flagellar hook-basal body complex protein FliE [Myxococcales bacterium]|nr:flagellar hook-basal body complex protein FliE [Myxococcales bacterium]
MSIAPVNIAPPSITPVEHTPTKQGDLGDVFAHALTEASNQEKAATSAAERFAKGDPTMGIHEVMIASEKANIEVRYATTLKNKAIEAYRELMNTQV